MLVILILSSLALGEAVQPLGRSYWEKSGREELESSLKREWKTGLAKNVILFIGDGMGPNTATAARIYRRGAEGFLVWERFPHFGAIKTYAADKQVPDSANTATAIFSGVKVNYNTLGVDESVLLEDCQASLNASTHTITVATLAQQAGKSTGIVTTARVTHATPGAMYAHSASRYWESDAEIPHDKKMCKDIASQLVQDIPGRDFNVILGGGKYPLGTKGKVRTSDYNFDEIGERTDGRNLIEEWATDKASRNLSYAVVNDTASLLSIDTDRTDYLLGIFANNHMQLEFERDEDVPSLTDMTTTAIRILKKNKNGFILMVESALIDLASHHGKARKALHEVQSLEDAVNATLQLLESAGILEETLVLVTSDHSHTLSISGYPDRGKSILDTAGTDAYGVPYTTLGFANAPPENFHYKAVDGKVTRDNPLEGDRFSFEYSAQAGATKDLSTHGGSDVFIYAKGPYAHLFHSMHEQNYIATVMKYATKLGEYSSRV